MCNWKIRCVATFMLWAGTNQGAYACQRWISRDFTLHQSNGPVGIFLNFSQHGFMVGGWAAYTNSLGRVISGMIDDGALEGNHLHFLVPWTDGTTGVYDADVDNSDRLTNGRTFNRDNPSQNATWKPDDDVTLPCCLPHPNPACATGRACIIDGLDYCVSN
jgi:hypothetical protein